MINRRAFVKAGSLALGAGIAPFRFSNAFEIELLLSTLDNAQLVQVAIDAARSAGSSYADAQIRFTRSEAWSFMGLGYNPSLQSVMGLGVRAYVNGFWGFAASSGIPSIDDAAKLGRTAFEQARTLSRGKQRDSQLASISRPAQGTWRTPVEIDPFTVSFEEKADFFISMNSFIQRQRFGVTGTGSVNFVREERMFASTDGALANQTIYTTGGSIGVGVPSEWQTENAGYSYADFLTTVGGGWEYIRSSPIKERVALLINNALRSRRTKPVEVGRYDIVFSAAATADLLDQTIGLATELDRAFGYEANNSGTSYLSDPLEMLGTFKLGSPLLTVTANRSMPRGAATVKWDDEGVEPRDSVLVKDGTLNDFQTTREAASWIAPYYDKNSMSVQSNGCAGVYSVTAPMGQFSPNLVMRPGVSDISFADMIRDTKKGLAVVSGSTNVDFQALNGTGRGEIYEIINGKLGLRIAGAEYLFRSPDTWKNLIAIGGKSSQGQYAGWRSRGSGTAVHTVSAVPCKITGMAITDFMRKS